MGVKTEAERDFIWVDTEEPHNARRKALLKKHPEIKKLMRYEPLTKYISAALVTVQLAIAFQFTMESVDRPLFWITAYVIGGSINQFLFLACHEASHNLLFQSFTMNKLFGLFMNLPIVVPHFAFFKFYHMEHHKNQGKDGIDSDLPTAIEARLLSNPLGKLFFVSFQVWFYALRPICIKLPPFNSWIIGNYVVQLLFIYTVYVNLGLAPIIYLLASDHFAGSIHPLACHFIAEHYVFDNESETYSYYGPINWFTLNVGYHNEHHDFPNVPWSRLPELHEIASDTYKNLPHHTSYADMLWKFLTSNKYSLYSRVKRK